VLRREVLEAIDLDRSRRVDMLQVETTYRALKLGFRVADGNDRCSVTAGREAPKMSKAIVARRCGGAGLMRSGPVVGTLCWVDLPSDVTEGVASLV